MLAWVSLKDGRRQHKPMRLQWYLETWKKWTLLGVILLTNSEKTYSFIWVLKNYLQVKLTTTEYLSNCLINSKGIMLLGMTKSKCPMVTHVKITLLLYSTLNKPFNCFSIGTKAFYQLKYGNIKIQGRLKQSSPARYTLPVSKTKLNGFPFLFWHKRWPIHYCKHCLTNSMGN